MDRISINLRRLLDITPTKHIRSINNEINWKERLIGILGPRGCGKTTLLLQRIKMYHNLNEAIYTSLDEPYFIESSIVDFVDNCAMAGIKYIYLDEIHQYINWEKELKIIYDTQPKVYVIFSGSSVLKLEKAKADLSRRAMIYRMQGFSYREYLNFKFNLDLPIFNLDEIIEKHADLSSNIMDKVNPLIHFNEYLKSGYFPTTLNTEDFFTYKSKLWEIIRYISETEIRLVLNVDYNGTKKIIKVLSRISSSVPFTPNMTDLSSKLSINRATLTSYLYALKEAKVLTMIEKEGSGFKGMHKPAKILLNNTNYSYALSSTPDITTIRETFFVNQVGYKYDINYSDIGDFKVDHNYIFEVGGKNKGYKQIANTENAFIASDDIEMGFFKKIPLYLFGFLY